MQINDLSEGGKDQLKDAIRELSDSMTRVAAEKDLQKEIISKVHEELDLSKKLVRKVATVYFKSTFEQEKESAEEFETAYSEIFDVAL